MPVRYLQGIKFLVFKIDVSDLVLELESYYEVDNGCHEFYILTIKLVSHVLK